MAWAQKKQFGCLSIVMFSQSRGGEPYEGDRSLTAGNCSKKEVWLFYEFMICMQTDGLREIWGL